MSHPPSPFGFAHPRGHLADDSDLPMIDPSSVRLPDSTAGSVTASSSPPGGTPIGNVTPQPIHAMGDAANSFWAGAKPGDAGGSAAGGPVTPLWPFEAFNPSSSSNDGTNSTSSGNIDSTHTTPASATAAGSYPFSRNAMAYRNEPMNNGYTQTPMTAATQWSHTAASTIDPFSMPPPPPNTASAAMASPHAMGNLSMSYSGPFTGLSPMFAGFTTSSPTIESTFASASASNTHPAAPSPVNPQLNRPGGPIRTYSASATIPTGSRKRSTTMMSLGPITSASPGSGTFNTYPYPSPRMTNPFMTQPTSANTIQPPTLMRQPSAPVVGEAKRVFHPSPATSISPAIGVDLTHLPMEGDYAHRMGLGGSMGMGMGMGMGMRGTPPMESKPPRFKPTKEQLEILIKAYDENKNPDGAAREALAKRLGPDVRPKTLQIWFQNRRSKSRAKERDANLPKPLHTRGGSSSLGHRSSASTSTPKGGSKGVDMEALRGLIHEDDPGLTILPISVLSIANWTRFLMPGTGTSHPDLAASLRLPPSPNPTNLQPQLYLYVVHKTDTFRIEIPLIPACVTNLQAASNPSLNAEAVAIRFELSMGSAKYAAWEENDGQWNEVGDFTGGESSGGGKCELTGDKDILLSSFSKVQQILAGQPYPTPIGTAPLMNPGHSVAPSSSSGSSWRFPSVSASTSFSSTAPIRTPSLDLGGPQHVNVHHARTQSAHRRQRSLSHPDITPSSSSSEGEADKDQFAFPSTTGKGITFAHSAPDAGQVPLPLATIPDGGRSENTQGQVNANAHPHTASAGTGMGDYGLSLSWAQLGSVQQEIETPGTGLSGWGFPMTSGSTEHSNGSSLHTPLSSSMTIGENSYHSLSTLTSMANPMPMLGSNSGARSTGTEVEHRWKHSQSSEPDIETPPFELDRDAMDVDPAGLGMEVATATGGGGEEGER